MSVIAIVRSWLSRLTASVPTAWHYDRPFRWMVIGAGISLVVFVLRPHNPATSRTTASAPLSSVSASRAPTHDASAAGTPLAPPSPALPNIPPADRWTV